MTSTATNEILSMLADNKNKVMVEGQLVEITGSLSAAILLRQLIYWYPRASAEGYIAKTDKEFAPELYLTRYALRKARRDLERLKFLKTWAGTFAGRKATIYRPNLVTIEAALKDHRLNSDNQGMPLSENEQLIVRNQTIISETTPETTISETTKEKTENFDFSEEELIKEFIDKKEAARLDSKAAAKRSFYRKQIDIELADVMRRLE